MDLEDVNAVCLEALEAFFEMAHASVIGPLSDLCGEEDFVSAVFKDIFDVFSINMPKGPIALALLLFATTICWSYGRGRSNKGSLGSRILARLIKYFHLN